jgi:uncharacterized phage-associated protein
MKCTLGMYRRPTSSYYAGMASVHDVAAYILKKTGSLTTWKLQKLVYYCQAWSLVWDEKPLFSARIEAWANGPVVPQLYRLHRGQFKVSAWSQGDLQRLNDTERETIDAVLKFYGKQTSQWLSDLTHREDPWINARRGVPADAPSNAEITIGSMSDYYNNLH